jgi:hypothetical protein
MQAYRKNLVVDTDGNLNLNGLPFQKGDEVEVIVLPHEQTSNEKKHYPLRGKPLQYNDPFSSVAENDWGILKQK